MDFLMKKPALDPFLIDPVLKFQRIIDSRHVALIFLFRSLLFISHSLVSSPFHVLILLEIIKAPFTSRAKGACFRGTTLFLVDQRTILRPDTTNSLSAVTGLPSTSTEDTPVGVSCWILTLRSDLRRALIPGGSHLNPASLSSVSVTLLLFIIESNLTRYSVVDMIPQAKPCVK
jgi:hypothetical protein